MNGSEISGDGKAFIVDYSDRSTAVLFGDGCAAAVVSASIPSRAKFSHCAFGSRPSAWNKVGIGYDWLFYQDGNAVQGFAIRVTTEGVKSFQKEFAGDVGGLFLLAIRLIWEC